MLTTTLESFFITQPNLLDGKWEYKPASEPFSIKDLMQKISMVTNFLVKQLVEQTLNNSDALNSV